MNRNRILIVILAVLALPLASLAVKREAPAVSEAVVSPQPTLTISEFITRATRNDTVFEAILIDELPLAWRRDLNLPARDIVLSVKREHDFVFNQTEEVNETTVSLSKLFPRAGTDLSAGYTRTTAVGSAANSSQLTFTVSQPIAENAFGQGTRLKDRIIGFEIEVARHQVIEAYEDYFAAILAVYYNWYQAYENLKIAESSYQENIKLLSNMQERQKSSIALSVDVDKINLQVLAKKEALIQARERYGSALSLVQQAVRSSGELIPARPRLYDDLEISLERDYQAFKQNSRTYQVLDLLEEKSSLEVAKTANELLPSLSLNIGYSMDGEELAIDNEDNMAFVEASLDWPFPSQVERAKHQTAKIALEKTKLSSRNAYYQLETDINNLFLRITRERQLAAIAQEKIDLAESILAAETENYSFGKVTLNDYIAAVNVLDTNRFNAISHDVQRKKLLIEWLRITDRLIAKKDIVKYSQGEK